MQNLIDLFKTYPLTEKNPRELYVYYLLNCDLSGFCNHSLRKVAENTQMSLKAVRIAKQKLIEGDMLSALDRTKMVSGVLLINPIKITTNDAKLTNKGHNRGTNHTQKGITGAQNNKGENPECIEIIDYLNEKAGKKFKNSIGKTIKLINARFSEGFTLEDFKHVIDVKVEEWKDSDMSKYIRPATLFSGNFESYLNQELETEHPFIKHLRETQEEAEREIKEEMERYGYKHESQTLFNRG